MMEVVFLPFLFAAYGIAIVEKAFFPDPRLRMSERVSKSHGWSLVAIRLTRSTQSFTLYGELWHILGILDPERFQFTAIVLQIAVFLAYHGLRTVDPSYLSYDPEVVKLSAWIPPRSGGGGGWVKRLCMWCALQFQHTVFPILCLVLAKPNLPVQRNDVVTVWMAYLGYVCWNAYCWLVQTRPAYPIQERLSNKSYMTYFTARVTSIVCMETIILFVTRYLGGGGVV